MLDPQTTAIQIVTNTTESFTFDTRVLSSSAEANLQDITGRQKHPKHGNLLSEIYQTSLYARSSQEYNRALMQLAQKKPDQDVSALSGDQHLGSRHSLSSSLSGGSSSSAASGSLSSSRDSSRLSSNLSSSRSSSSTTRPAPRFPTAADTSQATVLHHHRVKAPTTRHTQSSSSSSSSVTGVPGSSSGCIVGIPSSSSGSKGGQAGMQGVKVTPFWRGGPPRSNRFAGQERHASSSSSSSNRGQTGIQGVIVTPLRRSGRSGGQESLVSSSSSNSTAGSSNGGNCVQAGIQGVEMIPLRLRERFGGRESQVSSSSSSSSDGGGGGSGSTAGGQDSSGAIVDYASLDRETLLELFQWRWTTNHLS